jgi:hypothetical protein
LTSAAAAATSACKALQASFKAGQITGGGGGSQSSPADALTLQGSGSVQAQCCGFTLGIPTGFKIAFKIPKFGYSLSALTPYLGFTLSCTDATRPINQAAGVPWGGGRIQNSEPDPDNDENAY